MTRERLVILLLLGAGCEQLEPFMPTVSFERFDVNAIDFERVEADFVFAVDNPNPVEIDLASFDYRLDFEGTELLSGDSGDGFTLEAIGGTELRLPVDLSWEDAWDTVQATRGEDEVDFSLAGGFGFDTPLGVIELPYQEGGTFPAVRTPRFGFQTLRVARVDLLTQTATVELDLAIDNDHGSNLLFQDFDYAISLGGSRVASGLVPDLGSVEGASESTKTLSLDIDLLATGVTVVDLITNGGRADLGLDATMDVDTPFGMLPLSIDETGEVQVER